MKISFLLILVGCISIQRIDAQQLTRGRQMAERFQDLPLFKTGTQTYQYSSTDPKEDQFNDYFHWLYTDKDTSDAVLADIKGPGTIYRIWTTGNTGDSNRLKIYIDGETVPRINETLNDFHSHAPLRQKPQVGAGGDKYLAWWSYMPISFQKSIKIVREGNYRPFYNISYHTYSDAVNVKSWTTAESDKTMENIWNHPDKDPKPATGYITKRASLSILPGATKNIFIQKGAGFIASIKIKNYLPKKDFRIRMYWDNEDQPSVDSPLKWFFGSVDDGGNLKALGIGTVDNDGYCYFPMPFWKNARIELVNGTDTVTGIMDIEIAYNPKQYKETETGYFHAKANEVDKPGKNYTCLKTEGRGHVIGMAKRMPKGGHACEADEIFFIDGRKFPDIYGTGEEDYSNCAWWKNSYNSYPTHGMIGNDCYYRMHYPDLIVYEQGLDMEFESWQNYYIASLVWYYERDKAGLVKTDSLDVLNAASERAHNFKINGESWSGTREGKYPGKRIYLDSLSDDGRSFSKSSQFKITIDPANKGVRLRIRTEHINGQAVNVYVDGKLVTERPWFIMKNNFEALWVDSDFEIPGKYTKGKGGTTVRLKKVEGGKDWVGYRYEVFSYK